MAQFALLVAAAQQERGAEQQTQRKGYEFFHSNLLNFLGCFILFISLVFWNRDTSKKAGWELLPLCPAQDGWDPMRVFFGCKAELECVRSGRAL